MLKLIILALLLPMISIGQSNTFVWGEGMTSYTGTFDNEKYSLAEIELIYNQLYTTNSAIFNLGDVWKIEQMETENVATTDALYNKSVHILKTMKIPKGAFWDSLLVYRLREWREVYEAKRIYVLAMKDPDVLFDNFREECESTVIALNGSELDILTAWSQLKEVQKTKNCCPDKIEIKFQKKLNSPDRMKHARLELLKYEWWNCINQFIYRYEDAKIEKEFQKLFLKVQKEEEDHGDHDH